MNNWKPKNGEWIFVGNSDNRGGALLREFIQIEENRYLCYTPGNNTIAWKHAWSNKPEIEKEYCDKGVI